jgi:allantoin racemase
MDVRPPNNETAVARQVNVTLIDPVVGPANSVESFEGIPHLVLNRVGLRWGTASLSTRWDSELAAAAIIDACLRAEADDADAIVINSVQDPALAAAREVVRIPVVGLSETSMHLALCLADRFSILTDAATETPIVRELVEQSRLTGKAAPVRGISDDVTDRDPERRFASLVLAARAAVEDGATALILGCTDRPDFAARLSDDLHRAGLSVAVVEPLEAGIRHAVNLVQMGLAHSGAAYPPPPVKELSWPDGSALLGPTPTSVAAFAQEGH